MIEINGKRLCSLCFAEIENNSTECKACSGQGNNAKYPMALREGTILAGKYSVGRVLGKGGFGITYMCYDISHNKIVAIKEYMPQSLSFRSPGTTILSVNDENSKKHFKEGEEKFYKEAETVAKLNNKPNIISVYEFFRENNTAYFTMEYLPGTDMKDYIKEKGGKIPVEEALYITYRIAEALGNVHKLGILHRDISPDNIFICKNGDIKLMDFGAARQVIGDVSNSLSVILKRGFAPLEQYQSNGRQGPWTDIYALGATTYYAITGKVIDDAMSRLNDDTIETDGVSEEIGAIIRKMLTVKIENRYQNTESLIDVINAVEVELKMPTLKSASRKRFCMHCGKPIPADKETLQCDECEKKVTGTKCKYCRSCGKPIPADKKSLQCDECEKKTNTVSGTKYIHCMYCGRLIPADKKSLQCDVCEKQEKGKNGTKYRYCIQCGRIMPADKKSLKCDICEKKGGKKTPKPMEITQMKRIGIIISAAVVALGVLSGIIKNIGDVVRNDDIDDIIVDSYDEGEGIPSNEDGGIKIVDPYKEYDSVGDFNNGYAEVRKDGKYGLINEQNEEVAPPEYDFIRIENSVSKNNNQFVKVRKDNKYGLLNMSTGELVVSVRYDSVYENSLLEPGNGGFAEVKNGEKYGLVSIETGQETTPIKYDVIVYYDNGYARTVIGEENGLVDLSTGKEIISPSYKLIDTDEIMHIGNDSYVKVNDYEYKWGLVSLSTGKETVPAIYSIFIDPIDNTEYVTVSMDGKYGVVDPKDGRIIVSCSHSSKNDAVSALNSQ